MSPLSEYRGRHSRPLQGIKRGNDGYGGRHTTNPIYRAESPGYIDHNSSQSPQRQLKPSVIDQELTRKLKESAKLMDIGLSDHLVFAPSRRFYSFADEGYL
ncbi:MAG: hypothetical protein EOO06_13490 [Chitinophagaceae bacterium]|nr:MAG: hypothetical protein EOO06_13490 [Chitinophagaceae bacterium]